MIFGFFALLGAALYFMFFYEGRIGRDDPNSVSKEIPTWLFIIAGLGIFVVGVAAWDFFRHGLWDGEGLAMMAALFAGALVAGLLHLNANRRSK